MISCAVGRFFAVIVCVGSAAAAAFGRFSAAPVRRENHLVDEIWLAFSVFPRVCVSVLIRSDH